MAETSGPWDGTTTGDASAAPYDAATEFAEYLKLISGSGASANEGGVFLGFLNDLAPTSVGVSPVAINSGGGIVYGTVYKNTSSVNVAIPTPAGSTRIDRIVLRKSWAAQTIRLTRIAGAEGGAAPTMVQIPAVTWDVPIARASITTGGVITITDDREPANGALSFNTLPTFVAFDVAAAVGTSEYAARATHVHELTDPPVAGNMSFNDIATAGVATTLARSDHVHGAPKFHRKYKTVDLDATGAIDADLQCPVLAGEIYNFWGSIDYDDSGTATDIVLSLSVPGASTWRMSAIGPDTTTPATLKSLTASAGTFQFGCDAPDRSIQFRGSITITADGTFGLILAGSLGQPEIKKYSTFMAVKV